MTGNVIIDLAVALIGVAILAGLARLVFGASAISLDAGKAAARLRFDEPDFEPVDWLFSDAGDAALARNAAGETVLVMSHGDGLVTRRFPSGAMRAYYEDGRLTVRRADHTSRNAYFAASEDAARLWTGGAGGR